jgi:deferrochelatase/peroxidase EfeB
MHTGDPVTGVYRGADAVLAGIDREGFYIARARTVEIEAGGFTDGLANPRAK